MVGWDTNNKYEILNSAGQKVFYAVEGKYCNMSFTILKFPSW